VVNVSQCAVSIHIAHVVSVSHHVAYQFILSTWSACIAIYITRVASVSPYAISIHIVYMVSMCYHMLPVWPVSHHTPYVAHTVRVSHHINSYCLHGQRIAIYIAHVASVSPYAVSIRIVYMVSMCYHTEPPTRARDPLVGLGRVAIQGICDIIAGYGNGLDGKCVVVQKYIGHVVIAMGMSAYDSQKHMCIWHLEPNPQNIIYVAVPIF